MKIQGICTLYVQALPSRNPYTKYSYIIYKSAWNYSLRILYLGEVLWYWEEKKIGRIEIVKKSSEKLKFQQIFIDGVEQTSYFIDILIIYDFSSTQSMNINLNLVHTALCIKKNRWICLFSSCGCDTYEYAYCLYVQYI